MRLGLDSVGQFHQHLVSQLGDAIGVADGEPYWKGCLGQWQVWVNNGSRVYVCGVRLARSCVG
ncbi:MAG: hypothetical protein V7K69_06205 [Nostoc sp.]|uniref:hypothetical protein n=1 Tax=Nostoc sp. TaxID=1180 RepID=UPI002FF7405F